jgi:inorganic pyrophosphatase
VENNSNFWLTLDELVATSALRIDRPKGSAHPRYPAFIYPLDYGYLEGTQAADGGGIDVWVGGLPDRRVTRVTGVVCCVDLAKRDSEIKILLGCSQAEAEVILRTHNDGSQSAILIMRPDLV